MRMQKSNSNQFLNLETENLLLDHLVDNIGKLTLKLEKNRAQNSGQLMLNPLNAIHV